MNMVTKAKMTMQTDNEGERVANWSADVERMVRDNDSMIHDGGMMIVLNGIDMANANAMELKQFQATAEAHASNETMKYEVWDYQLNGIEWTARKLQVNRWRHAAECGKGLRAMGMDCSIGIASGRSARSANYNPNIFCWYCAEEGHFKRECSVWLQVKEALKNNKCGYSGRGRMGRTTGILVLNVNEV